MSAGASRGSTACFSGIYLKESGAPKGQPRPAKTNDVDPNRNSGCSCASSESKVQNCYELNASTEGENIHSVSWTPKDIPIRIYDVPTSYLVFQNEQLKLLKKKKLEKRTQTKPKFTLFYVISVRVLDIVSNFRLCTNQLFKNEQLKLLKKKSLKSERKQNQNSPCFMLYL